MYMAENEQNKFLYFLDQIRKQKIFERDHLDFSHF
jgi:hypothetical protein